MRYGILALVLLLVATTSQAQRSLARAEQQFAVCDYAGALENYKEALEQNDGDVDIIAHIARCYEAMGENLTASQWYEKIAETGDVKPEYVASYAHLLKRLNLHAKAKYYFMKLSQEDPVQGQHFAASCDFARLEQKFEPEYDVELLGSNTSHTEFSPTIYKDKIVFATFREDLEVDKTNIRGKQNETGNYLAWVPAGKGMEQPNILQSGVAVTQGVGPIQYSANGKYVSFVKNKWSDGTRLIHGCENMSIYTATVSGDGQWTDAKPFPFNGNDFATGYPALSEDGTILYFASDRPGGFGGFDLYVSFKTRDNWTEPQNLGSAINTPGNEITPFFIGKTLFFASDWHMGFGGFDIFKAVSDQGKWDQVYHLGSGINSERDDFGYVCKDTDGTGYFVSDRVNGRGKADIYMATPNFREVIVHVLSQESGESLADVSINFAGSDRRINTNSAGKATVHQPKSSEKQLQFSKIGYQNLSMRLVSGTSERTPKEYEVYMQKGLEEEVMAANTKPANSAKSTETPAVKKNSETTGTNAVAETSKPGNTSTTGSTTGTTTQTGNTGQGSTAMSSSVQTGNTGAVSTPSSVSPTPTPKPATTQVQHFADQFAIQVAALGNANYDPDNFSQLEFYGNVIPATDGKMIKVRVGYYETKEEAARQLKIVQDAGFKDAFIVVIEGEDIKPSNAPNSSWTNTSSQLQYKVRLATYSEAGNFDPSRIMHLGTIESYKKNQMTIMLLGGYTSFEQAKSAQRAAVANGFPDAYVVVDDSGVLIRARE